MRDGQIDIGAVSWSPFGALTGGFAWSCLLLPMLVPQASAREPVWRRLEAKQPDSLIRKIVSIGGRNGDEQSAPSGIELHRLPELNAVRIDLNNRASSSPGPPLVELSFRIHRGQEDAATQRLTYRNDEWYGSSYWTGPNWTRVGKNWHHPGENTPSVRCFEFPRDGRITVSGRAFKLHKDGDGVRLSVRHGLENVWQAEIDGKDGKGVEPKLDLQVRRGDRLRFIVHKRGRITCDTTHWDPLITYATGERFQASGSFAAHQQGAGGWYYEMLTEDVPHYASPKVYAFGKDLTQRETPLASNTQFEATQRKILPFFVIADSRTDSGVWFAAEPERQWTFQANATKNGVLQVSVSGSSSVLIGAYDGPWTASVVALQKLVEARQTEHLTSQLRSAYHEATNGLTNAPELSLLLMAQAEWRLDDKISAAVEAYAGATKAQLQRARDIQVDLEATSGRSQAHAEHLDRLTDAVKGDIQNLDEWRRLYLQVRLLKRDLLLSHPLLDSDALVFCKRVPPSYSHLVGQYYGWRQRPGGGLFVLERPGRSVKCRDVVGGQLPPGNYLEPRLSYDARSLVFSYVSCGQQPVDPQQLSINERGFDENYFHIYEIDVDGFGLRQLTSGCYDDMMPAYLPDGGIVFTSTRRRGYSRCFGPQFSPRWDSYTLHRMDRDGKNIRILSLNDVNEWFPAISGRGRILFARWDYIDRDAVTHQNLWSMRPDGTNPVSLWGNAAPKPHCTFQAKSIPGSNKIVFIASAHHSLTAGPVCLVDPSVDANSQEAITRVTPGPYPEAESSKIPEYYESPWPLSERLFLVAYSRDRLRFEGEHPRDPNPDNALGIYLLDSAGNRELIYRDPQISSTNPMPLKASPVPPVIHSLLPEDPPATGEMLISDIYEGLGDVPRGTIKQVRIIQIFPKTTPLANVPRIGLAGEENARAILGTVPVESDGSARFVIPAHKPILFQALDEQGFAYRTMRSTTYVQPGEEVACIGCHEDPRGSPPFASRIPLALQRPPSRIRPGELGGRPFSFVDMVQPVLDRQCVPCHGGEKTESGVDLTGTPHEGFTRAYWSLCGTDIDWRARRGKPELLEEDLVPRYWMRNQIQVTPSGGLYGARGSRLIKMLQQGHEDVQLSSGELHRLATWIDLNAIFYGVYDPDEQARQLRGELVDMPKIQ